MDTILPGACVPPSEPLDRTSVRFQLRALRRRRWLAAGVFVLAIAAAAVFSGTATPIYEARVKLLVEPESPNVVAFKEVVEPNMSKLDYYETQLGILRSRSLARNTIETLGLWNDPELNGRGTAMPAAPLPDETATQSRTIDGFLARLTLTYRADNRLVDVGVRSADPRRAAEIANTLARVFIADRVAIKLEASKAASDWLQARLAEQRSRVQASEDALQQYREANPDVTVVNQGSLAVQKLADLSSAATRAKTERIDAESLFAQLSAIRRNPASIDTLPPSLTNTYVQQLESQLAALQREEVTKSQRLGDRHPDMLRLRSAMRRTQEQLEAEVSSIAESVRLQTLALAEKERSLAGALEAQKRQVLAVSGKNIQYAALEREASSNRVLLDGLLQRAKEAQLSSELDATSLRIVDPAELPLTPVFPRHGLNLLLAGLIGLPLAIGVALARDRIDDRIASPEEITGGLRIRFLGFAPAVPKRLARRRGAIVNDRAVPEFGEALRSVRANLLLSAPAKEARTLLVTSTGPNEGKTLVASNLGVALAQARQRVLVIDADLRRAAQHEMFGLPLGAGLADVLQQTGKIGDVVQSTGIGGLSIITAGKPAAIPGDLLDERALSVAIASVRDQFDWIVIDSPPVMVASDAVALAHAATAVVFVVGAGMTSVHEAKVALERLAPAGATIIGAVLSRAPDDHQSPYSYRRYAGYYGHRR